MEEGETVPNRIIKESICTSENLNQLSIGAENLFYRLIVKADDFGCYYGNVKIIKNTCYPLRADAIKDEQISDWLNELVKAGLIIIYQAADGKQYIKLTKWEKHQKKRAKNSKYPLPDDENIIVISSANNCVQMSANVPEKRETRIENTRNENREYENTDINCTQTPKPEKIKYADFVSLTNDEYSSLVAKLGEDGAKRCIEILDNYKGATGKKYKSDYRAILNWVVDRYQEEQQRKKQQDKPIQQREPPQATNFQQRQYSSEFYDKIKNAALKG